MDMIGGKGVQLPKEYEGLFALLIGREEPLEYDEMLEGFAPTEYGSTRLPNSWTLSGPIALLSTQSQSHCALFLLVQYSLSTTCFRMRWHYHPFHMWGRRALQRASLET
jgi:hypothetical protein